MADVYWSNYSDEDIGASNFLDLMVYDIKPITPELKRQYKGAKQFNVYTQCPSHRSYFKNTFVVTSPFNLELSHSVIDGIPNVYSSSMSQGFFDKNVIISDYEKENQLIQLAFFWQLFSSDDISVEVMPAILHSNNFIDNTIYLPGEMNISKWFRPIQPAFMMKTDKVSIKTGDVLFYIKFKPKTDGKVTLKHFDMTDKLKQYQFNCAGVKNFSSHMSLQKLYNLFANRNYNKKIITEIKKNLTGDFE